MQKKIMAAAVAGALALPVTALAQTSTVNIYGAMNVEYGIMDQGHSRPKTDYMDTPGSNIGFRGEEKLGGNLSAWFQCETSADFRGFDQVGLCSRNSAVGFKGSFGNLFFGKWDTPMKRAMNIGTVGAEETGIMGMSFLPFGGSGSSDSTLNAPPGSTSTFGESQQRQRFKRRENGLTYYESPALWGGFQVLGAFSTGNGAADNGATDCGTLPPTTPTGCNNDKPRIWSIAASYIGGPFGVGVAYEKHKEFGALGGPATLDDDGWGISGAYTFGGFLKIGATFLERKWETAPGRELKKKTTTLGAEWNVSGPHSIEAQWAHAWDSKGNSLLGIGGNGGANAPRAIVGGQEVGVSDTGADAFSIAYRYAFSKRTSIKFAYVVVDNDSNSTSARIGGSAGLLPPQGSTNAGGQNLDGFAFKIFHRF